jgi:hypothetical protein
MDASNTLLSGAISLTQLLRISTGRFSRPQLRFKRCVTAQWQDSLTNELDLENVDTIGEIKLEYDNPGIEYIFMNYLDETSRRSYISGHKLYDAAQGPGANQAAFWTLQNGYNSYLTYIKKRRDLLRRYLEKINVVDNNILVPTSRYEMAVKNIVALESQKQQIIDFNIFLSDPTTFSDKKQFSPFAPKHVNDSVIILPIGGGRSLRLEGMIAQYWSLRFSKRIVWGATDITNYIPREGGTSFGIVLERREYGWDLREGERDGTNEYNLAEHLRPANFRGVREPYKILDIDGLAVRNNYFWNDHTYSVRGVRGEDTGQADWQPDALLWGPPEGEGKEYFSPVNMFYSFPGDDPAGPGGPRPIAPLDLKVEHLVRAGFVDTDLIKKIAGDRYGWDSVGFADDVDDDGEPTVGVRIVGHWPWIRNYQRNTYNFWNGGGAYGNYTGPMYLVDDDLDFVGQVRDFKDVDQFDNAGFWDGWHAEDWIKMWYGMYGPDGPLKSQSGGQGRVVTGRFAAWPDGFVKIYPNIPPDGPAGSPKGRMARGMHLPNLGIEAIRRISEESVLSPQLEMDSVPANLQYNSASRPSTNYDFPYGISDEAWLKDWWSNHSDQSGTGPSPSLWESAGYNDVNQYYADYENIDDTGFIAGAPGSMYDILPTTSSGIGSEAMQIDSSYALGAHMTKGITRSMNVHTILNGLPDEFERGFFTSVKWANDEFGGGAPLNKGLEKYIVTELMNLFEQGRRIAVQGSYPLLNNPFHDVTYGDLFPDEEGKNKFTTSMADFSRQTIQNVAEIPIKREVVDNLLNRRNRNMSLLQFMQQILDPSAIGLNGNVHVGVRMDSSNVMELIPASISYKGVANDMFENALAAELEDNKSLNEYLLFDYKTKNSLIENIDMSSKMDPAAYLTYQNSSSLLTGRDFNVLKLLSYEGVAEDFKEYLENTPKASDSGQTYTGIISIGTDNKVSINKLKFENIPSAIIDGAVAQNPERWARIIAIMQGNDNFTTELLAFYMRGVTLTIHGTTNIQPFNLINVTGVMPDLEGIYIVTNITEKVTPTVFQTIIEGKLLKRRRVMPGEEPVPI